ncbi:MAG: ribbon-helix-helix protein, CopG family [Acidobacteria bacterium]|nr:ribbon-helix-helix protein, CopG family [Acidobacteriota bacterium]
MTKKATILFPPALYREIEEEARLQGRSVGELVREAAMIRYGSGGVSARIEAVERLAKLDDDIGDPEQIEDEIMRGALEP